MEPSPPHWLWRGVTLAVGLALTGALILLGVLWAGWNDPRPAPSPDWQASAPRSLSASAEMPQTVALLEQPAEAFTFEASATVVGGADFNAYGLVFHALDSEDYTLFAVGGDGYLAVIDVAGEGETELLPWHAFPHIRRGPGPNRLRVTCGDGICRFWVNEEIAATLPDEGTGGEVGLWVRWYEGDPVDVRFSDIALWED